jgi:transitional endoplasmic reticulum ATPase
LHDNGNESGLSFIEAKLSDLKKGYVGQSGQKVREYFDRARESAPSILFIDEIDAVAAKRDDRDTDSFTKDIVDEMLTQMEGVSSSRRHVFVLGATNHPENIDPAILRRFSFKIEIPNPDAEQRRKLFQIFLSKKSQTAISISRPWLVSLPRSPKGMSGSDIRTLVDAAAQLAFQRALETGTTDRIVLSRADLLAQWAPQGKEVSEADIQKAWSQIVLKAEIKDTIMTKIRMFTSNDPAAPRGLLLYGPSGTGKTEIARRIADSAGCRFMSLTGSSLKSKYAGESGELVRKRWEEARSYGRCVMFVDECEGAFSTRGGLSSDQATDDLVREFLAMWDGVDSRGQVWVVGATNHRDQIDDAIMSRFGAAVEIGLPGPQERLQIARLEMKKLGRLEAEIPDFVAAETNGFSGRELAMAAKEVCTLAAERKSAIVPDLWKEVIARQRNTSGDSAHASARWENLVLAEDTIRQLQTICKSLKNLEFLQAQGMNIPRGALLYGPPGQERLRLPEHWPMRAD